MCLLSVLAAGLLTVFTQLNYPSDEWRHNYLHPQLCAPTGDPAAFAIVAQAIFIFAFIFGENDIFLTLTLDGGYQLLLTEGPPYHRHGQTMKAYILAAKSPLCALCAG